MDAFATKFAAVVGLLALVKLLLSDKPDEVPKVSAFVEALLIYV